MNVIRWIAFAMLWLLAAGPSRAASTIDAMFAECKRQMACGSCGALQPISAFTTAELDSTRPILTENGVVRVPFRAFVEVRGAEREPKPTDLSMCIRARDYCTAGGQGDARCVVAYSFWGVTPVDPPCRGLPGS